MIIGYENFIDSVGKTIIFRAKNFTVTDCDFNGLVEDAYMDIMLTVNLNYIVQEILIEKDIYEYTLPNFLQEPYDNDSTKDILDIYGATTDIVDDDFYDISGYVVNNNPGEYIFEKTYVDEHIGKTILVKRVENKDIRNLTNEMYVMLKSVIVDGVLYYIHDAIPSQVDTQGANLKIQRFYSKKEKLKEQLPQFSWFDGRQVGTQPNFGGL